MAESKINSFMDLLWENPNPTTSFSSQTITVKDMNNYKFIIIYFGGGTNEIDGYDFMFKGMSAFYSKGLRTNGDGVFLAARKITYVDNTHLSFSAGYQFWASGSREGNDYAIPKKIYGVK